MRSEISLDTGLLLPPTGSGARFSLLKPDPVGFGFWICWKAVTELFVWLVLNRSQTGIGLITMYYILVYSVLQYAISNWGSASTYILKNNKEITEKIIRLIAFSSSRSNAEKLHAQFKILNHNDIYKSQIAKSVHQIKHGCLQSLFNNLITKLHNIHSYNIRQKKSQVYIVHRIRLATGQKSLAYMGVKIWEPFDQKLKLQHFYVFKKNSKLHIWNQY